MKTTLKIYFWSGIVAAILLFYITQFEGLNYDQPFWPFIKALFTPSIVIFVYMNLLGIFLALLEAFLGLLNGGKSIWYGGSIWSGK